MRIDTLRVEINDLLRRFGEANHCTVVGLDVEIQSTETSVGVYISTVIGLQIDTR